MFSLDQPQFIDFEITLPETGEFVSVSVKMWDFMFVAPEKHGEWLLARYHEKLAEEALINNQN